MPSFKRTVLNLIGDRLMTQAQIADVVEVSKSFRFIEIESKSFKNLKLNPGEKIQINIGHWEMRTYTPLSLDRELGRLGILAYVNGHGPGSLWVSSVKAGDACQVFGPRTSLRLPEKSIPSLLLFGDETTIALAASLKHSMKYRSTHFVFEATDPDEVQRVIKDLGLQNTTVLPKAKEGVVSEELVTSVQKQSEKVEQVLLMGKAESIQGLQKKLQSAGIPRGKIRSKVYWATGRTGLD